MLLPYCLLVRIKSVLPSFEPVLHASDCTGHWEQMIESVLPSTLSQSLFAIFLIFIQAVMLNRITIKHRLSQKMTLFPGMIYIILCSVLVENLSLTQFTIGNFFAILALSNCIEVYKKFKPEQLLFSTGFWLGVAMLFSPIYFLLYIPIIGILFSLRTFSIKEFIQVFIGMLTSLLIMFAVHSFFAPSGFIETYFNFSINIESLSYNPFIFGYLALIALLILITIGMTGRFTLKKSLPSKKKIEVLYLILFSSLGLIVLNCNMSLNIFYYLWIPLSILISMLVIRVKYLAIAEVFHLLVLVLIINNHFNFLSLI